MTSGPTVLITGATDGLGLALAQRLSGKGYRLLLHGRDDNKLDRTADQIQHTEGPTAGPPTTLCADFSDLTQVHGLAETVFEATDRLDVLVNNAGIAYTDDVRELSSAGHELRFAVNFLAPFDLTLRLLPLLVAAGGARVVNVASAAQQPIDLDDVMLEHGYSGPRAYGQSKFAMIAAGFALARRLDPHRVSVNSVHPQTMMPTKQGTAVFDHSVDDIETGVNAIENLVTNPALAGVSGRYFNKTREAKASAQPMTRESRSGHGRWPSGSAARPRPSCPFTMWSKGEHMTEIDTGDAFRTSGTSKLHAIPKYAEVQNDPGVLKTFNDKVVEEFRANGGKVGGPYEGTDIVLLTMTGAKSGQQ